MNLRTLFITTIALIGAVATLALIYAKHEPVFSPFANTLPDLKSVQEMKQRFVGDFRTIHGIVQNIISDDGGGKIFTIETRIPNISLLGVSGRDMLSMVVKTVKVSVTDKTTVGDTLPFNVGDTVDVLLDQSVYFANEFEALKISHYSRDGDIKKAAAYSEIIHGTITSITKNSLVVKAKVADLSKLAALDVSGSFTVPYTEKYYKIFLGATTSFSGASFANFKTGDSVTAWGSGNLLDKSSFTATRLRLEK
jgi:hypothetical protein